MEVVNSLANFLQGIVLRVLADWRVSGRENVPPMGALIVVANHRSNFDPSLLSTSLPRRIRFLAKKEIFQNPAARWFLTSYGAHPLNRDAVDVGAYRWALDELAHDRAIVLFPEGTRARGAMKKAKTGVARIALKTQAPILPVGITGTEPLGSVTRVFNPTGELRVNIGTVFTAPNIEGRLDGELLDSITSMIMQRVAALLPPDQRGVYSLTGTAPAVAPGARE